MHERNKYKFKHLDFKRPIWKLQDDYTGFSIYSHQAVQDWRGYITKRGQADPEPIEDTRRTKYSFAHGRIPDITNNG